MSTNTYQTKKAVIYRYINSCSPTLKSYIGYTNDFERRNKEHKNAALRGDSGYFYNSVRKDGWKNFIPEILDQTDDIEYARDILESRYIKLYESFHTENGYNLTLGGRFPAKELLTKRWNKESKCPPKKVLVYLYVTQKLLAKDIADMFEVTDNAICRWLKKYEIKSIQKTERARNLSSVNAKTIAEKWDVDEETVIQMTQNYGLPKFLKKPDKNQLQELYNQKQLTSREIAKIFCVSKTIVLRWMNKYDIPRDKTKKVPPKSDLINDYVIHGLSQRKMGKKYRVCHRTVGKWLESYGIHRK